MEKMIPIISDIQDVLRRSQANFHINLPTIAVVGSQSTGKSSLLESIIGRELLPKGKGIVTRRPLQIQLSQITGDKEYAQFVDRKGEHFESMEQFRKLIEVQTDRMCGGNKGISNIPLRIRYCSRRVLDLMLVDLPGIVKNPIGDQPRDIQDQVLRMIRGYIKNPNCIIIAVSRATDDSANSQSLKVAREADKEGARTIGVLTHVDMIEENVNILKEYNTLSNKVSLGHTCVYLRPLKSCYSLEEQYKKEEEFFQRHEQYSAVSQKMGVRALVRTLNVLLVKHIKLQLPSIREALVALSQNKKNRMAEYGEYQVTTDKKAQGIVILALVNKYVKCFVEMIQGKYSDTREAVIGGARIQYIFSQIFIKAINRLDPFEHLTDNDIRTAIRNANGLKKSLFLPEAAFESLVKNQIMRLKYPSLECAHLIHEELRRLIYMIKVPQIQRQLHLH